MRFLTRRSNKLGVDESGVGEYRSDDPSPNLLPSDASSSEGSPHVPADESRHAALSRLGRNPAPRDKNYVSQLKLSPAAVLRKTRLSSFSREFSLSPSPTPETHFGESKIDMDFQPSRFPPQSSSDLRVTESFTILGTVNRDPSTSKPQSHTSDPVWKKRLHRANVERRMMEGSLPDSTARMTKRVSIDGSVTSQSQRSSTSKRSSSSKRSHSSKQSSSSAINDPHPMTPGRTQSTTSMSEFFDEQKEESVFSVQTPLNRFSGESSDDEDDGSAKKQSDEEGGTSLSSLPVLEPTRRRPNSSHRRRERPNMEEGCFGPDSAIIREIDSLAQMIADKGLCITCFIGEDEPSRPRGRRRSKTSPSRRHRRRRRRSYSSTRR